MERQRDTFHQKDKIHQKDIFSVCIQGRVKLHDVIVKKTHSKCTNQLASSIVF